MDNLQQSIMELWADKDNLHKYPNAKESIDKALSILDSGKLSIAYKERDAWKINEWLKQAILLSFRINKNALISGNANNSHWYDKVSSKFEDWNKDNFAQGGFRVVPSAYIRRSAYLAKNVIVMPSFINVGAYVNEGTMIDSYVTVGSCAYIGKHCHISSSTVIGGVLEPINAASVIIEDNCFIGANSSITEGVIVQEGSVIASGVQISASTKIYNALTGEISYGLVPKYSVVIAGVIDSTKGYQTQSAIIIKQVDANTRSKILINDLLRD